MKILVVGSGGREHAICWKLRQSSKLTKLWCAPGNPGIASIAECLSIPVTDSTALVEFAREEGVDLTVVGPELPLASGIVDTFKEAGLRIVGPRQAAAQLESSKRFSKEVMVAAGVPTARYEVFTDLLSARHFLEQHPGPWVIKADGLAAGKGVFVCADQGAALAALPKAFEVPGSSAVVIEQLLIGREASFIVAVNGIRAVPLLPAHDYKRIGDNDQGPNTGGMGTVCPTPRMTLGSLQQVQAMVIDPVLRTMAERGTPFQGFLFAGLMISPSGEPFVLEYNVRLGDPETQSILALLESDLIDLLLWISSEEEMPPPILRWRSGAAVCVVHASDGYPEAPRAGDPIDGLELSRNVPQTAVFHAGTKQDGTGRIVTAGGRVLNVVARGGTIEEARGVAYRASDLIQFRGKQMRRDIGV